MDKLWYRHVILFNNKKEWTFGVCLPLRTHDQRWWPYSWALRGGSYLARPIMVSDCFLFVTGLGRNKWLNHHQWDMRGLCWIHTDIHKNMADFKTITLRKQISLQKIILCKSIYIKFKNRQKLFKPESDCLGFRGKILIGKNIRNPSGVLELFHLVWGSGLYVCILQLSKLINWMLKVYFIECYLNIHTQKKMPLGVKTVGENGRRVKIAG